MQPYQFRSIFISDVHLGTRNLQARQLLDFLNRTESEYLYLVGDIVDLLQAQKRWHWSGINDQIVQRVFDKAARGTKVIYIPGNHDHMLRKFDGNTINRVEIAVKRIHVTADGRRYLVVHGDAFDCVVQHNPWLANIGATAYELLLVINRRINKVRRLLGLEYRSISAWIKHQVKLAVNHMGRFEERIVEEAREHEVDGLICGHIHRATIRQMEDMLYSNSGDWVESCTALAENMDGTLGIIEWRNGDPLAATAGAKAYENMYSDRCLASTN